MTKQDRNDLEPADNEEDEDHEDLEQAFGLTFRREEVHDEIIEIVGLIAQTIQQTKKMQAIAKVRFRSAFARAEADA
ncbi:MAG: hypothetical protein WKF40_05940 [Thermoleophilaceae bacterium]